MAQSALAAALLAGLLGGVHCMMMCGGYVAIAAAQPAAVMPMLSRRALLLRQLTLHAGRLTTYACIGALFGGVGGAVLQTAWSPLQRVLYIVANLLLIVLAVSIVRRRSPFSALERVGLALHHALLAQVAPRLRRAAEGPARYGLGALWGATPCALVYGVLPLAMFAGSSLQGALVMLVFGLGTLPNLMAAGYLLRRSRRLLDATTLRVCAALLVAAFGVVGVHRALFLPEALAQGPFCLVP